MSDNTLFLLRNKLHDTYDVVPNHFGIPIIDRIFVSITRPLKTFPFKLYIPLALCAAIVLYFSIGFLIVRLASILQYGFK